MEDYQILGLSLCTYGENEDKITTSAKEFGVALTNVKQYKAGIDDIDSCYIADAGDMILLAFRGTITFHKRYRIQWDWIDDFLAKPVEVTGIPGKLHQGFSNSIERLWEQGFAEEVTKRLTAGKSLYITGYSKGAALAPIAASFLDKKKNIDPTNIRIYIFEPPRPGNAQFKTYFNQKFPTTIRYEYQDDIVPHLPPSKEGIHLIPLLNKIIKDTDKITGIKELDYQSVGNLHFVNWEKKITVLKGEEADEQFKHRIYRLDKLITSPEFDKILNDHSAKQHLYPVLSEGKPYPLSATT